MTYLWVSLKLEPLSEPIAPLPSSPPSRPQTMAVPSRSRPSKRLVTPTPKPHWLKVPLPAGERTAGLRAILRRHGLHTVCEEARCPNLGECWDGGTATFMVLGEVCTRACRFCAVRTARTPPPPDPEEPENVARAAAAMGLRYVVLTMVDRDDLEDGGAAHVAATIEAIRRARPQMLVEALTGDFAGSHDALRTVLEARPAVFAHNLETVERLTPRVRDPRCGYRLSLDVLEAAKRTAPGILTKTSLMLGLGESDREIDAALDDLRAREVDVVTFGQYLRPTIRHLPVREHVSPARFAALKERASAKGFLYVASGPLVRSSYKAAEHYIEGMLRGGGSDPVRAWPGGARR